MRLLDALRVSDERMVETTVADGTTLRLRRVASDADAAGTKEVQADGNAWEVVSGSSRTAIMRATLVELSYILNRMPGVNLDDWRPVSPVSSPVTASERTTTR